MEAQTKHYEQARTYNWRLISEPNRSNFNSDKQIIGHKIPKISTKQAEPFYAWDLPMMVNDDSRYWQMWTSGSRMKIHQKQMTFIRLIIHICTKATRCRTRYPDGGKQWRSVDIQTKNTTTLFWWISLRVCLHNKPAATWIHASTPGTAMRLDRSGYCTDYCVGTAGIM